MTDRILLPTNIDEAEARARFEKAVEGNPYGTVLLPGEPLVQVALVPVEVFGTECDTCETDVGYGLSDAVEPWSDCNRARGHIFRRDDLDGRDPDSVIKVFVPQSELAKFEKRFGDHD